MSRPRLPLTIRLNRSLFPVDLITLRTRRNLSLEGVEVSLAYTDDTLKSHGGGGGPSQRLEPSDSIDVFVSAKTTDYSPHRQAHLMVIRPGTPGIIRVTWERVNGKASPGEVCIAWTHEDRSRGKAPLIAAGAAGSALFNYVMDINRPISGIVLSTRHRIPEMRRRDIRSRIRAEKKRWSQSMDEGSQVAVEALAIQGFRGFREEAALNLAQPTGQAGSGLTIVVGANNTGKSTIWESFDAIARKLKSDVSFSEGRRNRATPGGIRIRLTREDGSTYLLESRNANTSETRGAWQPIEPRDRLEIVSVPSRRQFQATFGRGGTTQRDWMTDGTDFTRSRQNDQFTGRLFELHNNEDSKLKFDSLMTEVLGEHLEWTIELGDGQYGQSYYLKVTTGESVNHTSEGLGDGIISLLYILNALYDSEPRTLLVLDEPELSLHPQLVRRLGRVLARFASDRQIVVFTHSPLLVSWDDIERGAEVARVYKRGPDSRIAQVSRSTIRDVSRLRNDWRNPHALGVDATEALFLDDGIIVVEGQDDAVLLPRAFELAGVDFEGTIFGWGAAGAVKVTKVLTLLQELDFSRVAAVLDNNRPDVVSKLRTQHPGVLIAEIPAADIRDKKASNTPAVEGLLLENGRVLKANLLREATEVFIDVARYLKTGQFPSGHADAEIE